jgi:AcrR family transcriptional regulator
VNARERILQAARAEITVQPWSAITMAGLAQRAGVSRQSVYNEFGSKSGLAEALVAREVEAFLAEVDARIAQGTSPADSASRAASAVFEMARTNPVVRAAVTAAGGSPSPLLPLLTSQSAPLLAAATQRAREALCARHPALAGEPTLPAAVDAIVRLVVSHVVSPGAEPDLGFISERLL